MRTICAQYVDRPLTTATADDMARANRARAGCAIVLTWNWFDPSQDWCKYIMDSSSVEACGIYDNIGFGWTDNSHHAWIAANKAAWLLKDAAGTLVGHKYGANQTAYNRGYPDYVQWYVDYFKGSVPGWEMAGTYKDHGRTVRWLDDYGLHPVSNDVWNLVPIDKITGKPMDNAAWEKYSMNLYKALRADADANGIILVANLLGDAFWPAYPAPGYSEALKYFDFAVFEILVQNMGGDKPSEAEWLRRVKNFQWMAKNAPAVPVGTTEYGNYYFNLSTILLGCEPANGGCWNWQQPPPADAQAAMLKALKLGMPKADFGKAGCYVRAYDFGFIAANPTTVDCMVSLDGQYKNLETGGLDSGMVMLKPYTGKIWVRP